VVLVREAKLVLLHLPLHQDQVVLGTLVLEITAQEQQVLQVAQVEEAAAVALLQAELAELAYF
jgi:hypothetical protein